MDKSLENVKCPLCDGPMVSRKSSYGIFWGCKNFPNCTGTRDSMGRSKEDKFKERNEEYDRQEEDKKDGVAKFTFKKR